MVVSTPDGPVVLSSADLANPGFPPGGPPPPPPVTTAGPHDHYGQAEFFGAPEAGRVGPPYTPGDPGDPLYHPGPHPPPPHPPGGGGDFVRASSDVQYVQYYKNGGAPGGGGGAHLSPDSGIGGEAVVASE